MKIEINETHVRFIQGSQLVGLYVLNDPYKPHFADLRTPAGHNVVVISPEITGITKG